MLQSQRAVLTNRTLHRTRPICHGGYDPAQLDGNVNRTAGEVTITPSFSNFLPTDIPDFAAVVELFTGTPFERQHSYHRTRRRKIFKIFFERQSIRQLKRPGWMKAARPQTCSCCAFGRPAPG
ncbi:hypothetical protein HPB52_005851 [Rhipicephalus sanguineus]|uniref:Uncharacterized protein n=1 Tax=Rhipicephalus sanguineus TaxID=34632 RepID=A0A9D4Q542_RHISA|nr:hypothetical protein HPB52_005851 [Rhipicephalus sanguineus]